jgi:hypothetical protein
MKLLTALSVFVLMSFLPLRVLAHGGVSIEDDNCILKIAGMRAHFTGYQPELRATQEFCEDIPELGRAIIVIDFITPTLREQSVEFRVLRDVKNLKSAGRYEDLGSAKDIDAATVLKMPASVYSRGTITFDQVFQTPGWYIGYLTAIDNKTGKVMHSVFPFRVGVRHYGRYVGAAFFSLGLAGLAYYLTSRRFEKRHS